MFVRRCWRVARGGIALLVVLLATGAGVPIEGRAAEPPAAPHGRPLPRAIVVESDSPAPEKLGAREVQTHLRLLGVEAAIGSRAEGPVLMVGMTLLPRAAQKAFEQVRDDGFLLYRDGDDVYVAGKLPRGTLFGCYKYLESRGVRWGEPGKPAEATGRTFDLPSRPEEGVDNPDFPVRGNNCYCPTNPRDLALTLETVEWLARQRYNVHSFLRQDLPALAGFDDQWRTLAEFVHERGLEFGLGTHLSWPGLLQYEDRELYSKHPEYFPLKGEQRQAPGGYGPEAVAYKTGSGMSVCVSNPEVVKLIARNLDTFLDRHPEIDVMGMWPPDTTWEGCDCPGCQKLTQSERFWSPMPDGQQKWRATSDLVVHLVGEVAARIRQSHPGVRIVTWGWCTSEPAPRNVAPAAPIQVDMFYLPCFTHRLESDVCLHRHVHPEAWRNWAKVQNVKLGWIHTGAAWAMATTEFPHAWLIQQNVRLLRGLGGQAVSYNLEIGDTVDLARRGDPTDHYLFSACGLNYYVLGRCGWDTDADLMELYADFAEARFGSPAGEPMSRYFGQSIARYEAWQRPTPLIGLAGVWTSSEVRCRAPWEAVLDFFTPEMVAASRSLLDDAEARAADAVHQERVRIERRFFEHTMLMREVYQLHLARQKLMAVGATAEAELLRNKQLATLEQARKSDLPKNHLDGALLDQLGWTRP